MKTDVEAKKTSHYRAGNDNGSVYVAVCEDRAFNQGSRSADHRARERDVH